MAVPEPMNEEDIVEIETPAESVEKVFAHTWRRSESLKAELSPMITNRLVTRPLFSSNFVGIFTVSTYTQMRISIFPL